MIKANHYIGKKLIKNSGLPYRVNKKSNYTINKNIPENIKIQFKNRNTEKAYYSNNEILHGSLDLNYYVHFTSPIRRIIDTINHYYITYNKIIDFDLDIINDFELKTKKFHREIEILKKT